MIVLTFIFIFILLIPSYKVSASVESDSISMLKNTITEQPNTINEPIIILNPGLFFPYMFYDEEEEPSGFSVELLETILKEANLSYKIEYCHSYDALSRIQNNNADILLTTVIFPQDVNGMKFSIPFDDIHPAIVSRNKDPYYNINDLKNLSLSVSRYSPIGDFIHKYLQFKNISYTNTCKDALIQLQEQKCDVVIAAENQVLDIIKKFHMDNLNITIIDNIPSKKVAFGIAPKQDQLRYILNRGIRNLKANGVYKDLHNKWFGHYQSILHQKYENLYSSIFISLNFIGLSFLIFLLFKIEKRKKELSTINIISQMLYNTNKVFQWKYAIKKDLLIPLVNTTKKDQTKISLNQLLYFVHPEDKKIITKNIQLLVDKEKKELETQIRYYSLHKKDDYLHGKIILKMYKNRSSKEDLIIGLMLNTIDPNEIKKIINTTEHEKLLNYQANLKKEKEIASNQMKTNFLSYMSNEVETPLKSIAKYSALAIETETLTERKILGEKIEKETNILLSIIDNLLNISCLESGQININNTLFNIKELTENLLKSFENELDPNLNINSEYSLKSTEFVFYDRKRIQQIITNYISNAIKFTKQGSILLRIIHNEDGLTIEVHDTGIGIAEDKIHNLFDYHNKEIYPKGYGLGLPIVKAIVKTYEGEVTVDSILNKGSIFKAWLPQVNNK